MLGLESVYLGRLKSNEPPRKRLSSRRINCRNRKPMQAQRCDIEKPPPRQLSLLHRPARVWKIGLKWLKCLGFFGFCFLTCIRLAWLSKQSHCRLDGDRTARLCTHQASKSILFHAFIAPCRANEAGAYFFLHAGQDHSRGEFGRSWGVANRALVSVSSSHP